MKKVLVVLLLSVSYQSLFSENIFRINGNSSGNVGGFYYQNIQDTGKVKIPVMMPKNMLSKEKQVSKANPYKNADIKSNIIPSENNTFGYDILMNGKALIHQTNIPGMPGNNGFSTKEKAEKVSAFVIKKIRNNEMPPTVTKDELMKLDAIK